MSGSSVSVLELPVKFGPVKKVTPAVTGPASCAAAAAGSSSAAAAATTAVATRRRSPKRIIETPPVRRALRSEEHTSELQSLMRISYAVFCLKKKKNTKNKTQ